MGEGERERERKRCCEEILLRLYWSIKRSTEKKERNTETQTVTTRKLF